MMGAGHTVPGRPRGQSHGKGGFGSAFWSLQFVLPWPLPEVTPTSSPQDRCPRKGDAEQAHPGSSVGMRSKHLKAV